MTKIEELKAAYKAAGSERWEAQCLDSGNWIKSASGTVGWTEYNGQAEFIALAHNLMPQLLEAVEVLKAVVPLMDIAFNYDGDVFGRQHNNATDVYSAAECVLGELK